VWRRVRNFSIARHIIVVRTNWRRIIRDYRVGGWGIDEAANGWGVGQRCGHAAWGDRCGNIVVWWCV
jgi:hypothetical protein